MPPSPRSDGEAAEPGETRPRWRPPSAFDEYELIRPLGRGRSGLVFLAHDTLLDRQVAIKFIPSVEDAAVGRFLVEARAAARLQHPNVATLYRVGQLEGRPYLVSEFVPGTGLDRIEKPAPPELATRVALDLTRGLAAAHRRGVLHRDIKPGNTILAQSGEAKLLDFGLAKLRTPGAPLEPAKERPDSRSDVTPRLSAEDEAALRDMTGHQLLGTPYFMPPEAWRGDELDEQSDIYSLGALLYELVAGRGPFRDVALPDLPAAVTGTDARPVGAAAPGTPPELAAVIDRALARERGERFRTADEMLSRLELSRARRRAPAAHGNPYRGLRPFEPEHRAFFFGRDRPLARALERLRSEPLLVVTGDSGVGKSSFCAAALIPAITDGGIEDGLTRAVTRMVPGRSPTAALAQALAPLIERDEIELLAEIRAEPESLGRAVGRDLGRETGLLLYVDQLEELVTVAPADEAEVAAEAIGSLAAGLAAVRVVATARTDFLSRLEGLPGLRERVSRSLFLLAPLSSDEIREAIVGPAAVVGTRFESDALVETLVESTAGADGATPLLQFALAELWDRRSTSDEVIRERDLDELGGVEGALARHADALLAVLTPAERRAARTVLLRLVTVENTRSRRLESELLALSSHAEPALEALVRGRLLVAGETPDGTSYEIAHEALVRGWGTLAAWIAEEAETRALVDRIETAAAQWRQQRRAPDLLWGARQLAEVEEVPPEALTPREREFLAASQAATRRRRWVRRGAVALALLGGAGVWIGAQIHDERERDAEIAAALAASERAATAAGALVQRFEEAREAAFAAFDAGDDDQGERHWERALEVRGELRAHYGAASEPLERALLLEPDRVDVRRRYAELLYTRALMAERSGRDEETRELIRRMALYDEGGALMARWRAPARLEVTTVPEGAAVTLHRFRDEAGRLLLDDGEPLGLSPLSAAAVAPGSVLLEVSAEGRPAVRYPLLVSRGAAIELSIPIPGHAEMPDGFVWIPAGRSIYGSDDDEAVRAFFNAVPEHPIELGGFFIARHETTYGDWIEWLETIEPEARARRLPAVGSPDAAFGFVALRPAEAGVWELELRPATRTVRAASGETIRYPMRERHVHHDWLELPVSGVSFEDARAYAEWLDRSGRVPGARLCDEREWERAARGADGREFPHGNTLRPEDANFDQTYGKQADAFGPDRVGSHPRGRSPFGIDDMAGNVWEWTVAISGEPVGRGGGFAFGATSARSVNRQITDPTFRDITVGVRVCASAPAGR